MAASSHPYHGCGQFRIVINMNEVLAYPDPVEHGQSRGQKRKSIACMWTGNIDRVAYSVFWNMSRSLPSAYLAVIPLAASPGPDSDRHSDQIADSVELCHKIHGDGHRMIAQTFTLACELSGLEMFDVIPGATGIGRSRGYRG
jgi:hypothetical protein